MTDEARHAVIMVASSRGLTDDDLYGRDRSKTVSSARKEAMRQVRLLGLSYPEIGKMFGRHHATVIYACSGKKRPPKPPRQKQKDPKPKKRSMYNYWAASSR